MSEEKKTYTQEDFAKMYQEMVDKTGFHIIANPVWMPTNHGTFENVKKLADEYIKDRDK